MSSASDSRSRSRWLRNPVVILPVVVAAILIVCGRANRRTRWGNLIAIAGYVVLAATAVIVLLSRG